MALKNRKYIREIKVELENISPFHIGADNGEILIDEEENNAYIPATTLAGAFRAYLRDNDFQQVDSLFGEGNNMSKVFIYDSFTPLKGTEVRPNIKINSALGVNENKFQREYIASNHKFTTNLEIFANNYEEIEAYTKAIYSCIGALNKGDITLGAYKSSGAGLFKINKVEEKFIDLSKKKDLFAFLKDEKTYTKVNIEEINKKSINSSDITFKLDAVIETPILIKGEGTLESDRPDGEQMRNSKGEYILPGSSIKGVIRAQGEKILTYVNKKELQEIIFGSEESNGKKISSKVKIFDSIIKEPKEGIYHRIKLDKLTGGVIKGALMDDKPVLGVTNIEGKLKITKETDEEKAAAALLALIFRDLAVGNLSLGSGFDIGRGRLKGKKLTISKDKDIIYEYDFFNKKLKVDNMKLYFQALNKEAN